MGNFDHKYIRLVNGLYCPINLHVSTRRFAILQKTPDRNVSIWDQATYTFIWSRKT